MLETLYYSARWRKTLEKKIPDSSNITAFSSDFVIIIKSRSFSNGVPRFELKLNENMNFEAFYKSSRTHTQSLVKNRIQKLKSRSALAEALRFLREPHENHMNAVIEQHSSSISKFVAQ